MNHQINIGFDTAVEDEQAVAELIRICAERVLAGEQVPFDAEIDVTVVDAGTIRQLNADYRDKDAVTDVLSFPMYDFYNGEPREPLEREPDSGCVMLGDMILCYARAVEQAAEFGLVLDAEPGFYGDARAGQGGENAPEEGVELIRAGKEARALALCCDGAAGAAEVEIHLSVAHVKEQPRRPDEVVRIPAEQLRHEFKAGIVPGQKLALYARRHDVLLRRREKGRKIPVHAAEYGRMRAPERRAGHALHRRAVERYAHRFTSQ